MPQAPGQLLQCHATINYHFQNVCTYWIGKVHALTFPCNFSRLSPPTTLTPPLDWSFCQYCEWIIAWMLHPNTHTHTSHAHAHARITHMHTHTRTHAHARAHACTCTHAHTHTCTHTSAVSEFIEQVSSMIRGIPKYNYSPSTPS